MSALSKETQYEMVYIVSDTNITFLEEPLGEAFHLDVFKNQDEAIEYANNIINNYHNLGMQTSEQKAYVNCNIKITNSKGEKMSSLTIKRRRYYKKYKVV